MFFYKVCGILRLFGGTIQWQIQQFPDNGANPKEGANLFLE